MLLRPGVHPKVVQERLGRATVSITLGACSRCGDDAGARWVPDIPYGRRENAA